MKKNTLLLLAVCFSLTINAQTALKKVYNEDIDPIAQIDQAVKQSKSESKFVICQVGGNWCPWCLKFADFITNDTTISRVIDENFVYIHVNYNPRKSQGEEKLAQGKALMQRLNNAGRFGYPVFVVLDEEGKILHIQDSSFLEEGEGYNQEKVLRFFKNWTPNAVKAQAKAQAQETEINSRDLRGKVVYQNDDVVFRQLDEHTWIGNGHLCYNESLYLVEGNDRAILIDAGTRIPGLDKIVAKITSKPVTMMLTHAHGDHAGGVGPFPEVYLNAGDMPLVSSNMRNNYKGQIRYLFDGEVIDLGGREIEVIFTPGHTSGSTTFFDKTKHYGFSGDAFGSTNLLVFTDLSTEMYTAERIERYMKKNDIRFLFPGHYSGDNLETLQRVIDIKDMCREILDGERKPTVSNGNNGGMDMMVDDKGVRINFSSLSGMK